MWKDYIDPESDIDTYEVSLWRNSSCFSDSTEELIVDWIELTTNYTQYSFVELELKVQEIKLRFSYICQQIISLLYANRILEKKGNTEM